MNSKKIRLFIVFLLLFFAIFSVNIYAYDLSYINEEINVDDLFNSLPEDIRNNISTQTNTGNDPIEIAETYSLKSFITSLFDIFLNSLSNIADKTLCLLAIIIILSFINVSKNTLSSPEFSRTVSLITIIGLAVYSYELLYSVWKSVEIYLSTMDKAINAMLPIMTVLYTAGGNVSTAVVNSTGTAFALTVLNYILQHILFPVLKICFGLTIAGSVGGINGVCEIVKTIKSFFTVILSGAMTLFSIFLAFKTGIAASADGVAARTVKFAGGFVPVVGSALGESVRSIMSGLSLIKSSIGFIGILIIVFITAPPLINVLVNKICIDFSASIACLIGCEPEGKFLKEINSLYGFLIAIIMCVSIVFMFELTLFTIISPSLAG